MSETIVIGQTFHFLTIWPIVTASDTAGIQDKDEQRIPYLCMYRGVSLCLFLELSVSRQSCWQDIMGCEIWLQIGSDQLQIGQIWDIPGLDLVPCCSLLTNRPFWRLGGTCYANQAKRKPVCVLSFCLPSGCFECFHTLIL